VEFVLKYLLGVCGKCFVITLILLYQMQYLQKNQLITMSMKAFSGGVFGWGTALKA
jgi:hypothetical protein